MAVAEQELSSLTSRDLIHLVREIEGRIAICEAQLEPGSSEGRQTFRLVRGTFLIVGGFLGATFELWTLVLVLVGFWDWLDTIVDDAIITRRQLGLRRELTWLEL